MLLKACLNGARRPGEHPALPVSPAELAAATVRAVAAGADAVHVHPKDGEGADTLDGARLAGVLKAVRAASPGTPVGVTTGAWAAGSPEERRAAVAAWQLLPDFASVNWHEPGAADLAADLLQRGVGVEAGLWTPPAVEAWNRWPKRNLCVRVLLEVVEDLAAADAVAAAGRLLAALRPVPSVGVLMHGEGQSAWPVLGEAARLGLDARIGLEDVLVLPDGTDAADNAQLVTAARRVIGQT